MRPIRLCRYMTVKPVMPLYDQSSPLVFMWTCVAAHKGHFDAQVSLGYSYRYGRKPVERDLIQAYVWLALADDQAHPYTGASVRAVASQLDPSELAEAKRRRAEWKPNPMECEVPGTQAEN